MKTDSEIKKAVLDSIKWNSTIPDDRINVTVKNGWVSLSGVVEWPFQKSKAKLLAEDSIGVAGVTNLITVVSPSNGSWMIGRPLSENRQRA